MTEWVIPCNVKKEYDVIGAFSKLKKIDWKQSTNIEVGDVVYVYAGDPIKSIRYKCIVNKVNIEEPDIDDSEFVLDYASYSNGRYMEIELLEAYDNEYLSYGFLLENGLRTVQGPSRVTSRLSKYLFKMTVKFDPGLKSGQIITHEKLMQIFHCGNMGGMLPSNDTNTLVILSYPEKGPYHDRWEENVLHYTGEGQIGDQKLKNNNKKLADSDVNGIGVHLFEVPKSNEYVYGGQVHLVGKPYQDNQPDINGNNRRVWIFPVSVIEEEKGNGLHEIPWVDKEAAFNQKVKAFQMIISDYKEREIHLEELREQFVNDYKIQTIINMKKEDYVVGQGRHDTFCYRLENELAQLGNIHGSTSVKFGLYYGVKGADKEYKYRTTKLKFGEDPDQALQTIKEQIVKLIVAGEIKDNDSIKLNLLSPLFKGKILSVYYPEKYLSIFSKEHLEFFLSKLDLPFDKEDDELDMQIKLLNWKESNEYTRRLSNYLFVSFLYCAFGNISEINKEVDNEQEEKDKAYPKEYMAKVNISIEQWKRLLQNKEIFFDEDIEIIKSIYRHDNYAATCLEVSIERGINPSECEWLISDLGKRISNEININPVIEGLNKNNVLWSMLFWGSYRDDGYFEWKLRPKLVKALIIVYPDLDSIEINEKEDINLVEDLKRARLSSERGGFEYRGKPKRKQAFTYVGSRKSYPRDRETALNALSHANYLCEINSNHPVFLRKRSYINYTEPHHLIPMSFSDMFDVSLDVEENIVSLCSNCHNNIHYGQGAEVLLKELYEIRKYDLEKVDIKVTIEELLKMYNL